MRNRRHYAPLKSFGHSKFELVPYSGPASHPKKFSDPIGPQKRFGTLKNRNFLEPKVRIDCLTIIHLSKPKPN